MTDPTRDVAKMTRDLIQDEWDSANTKEPAHIELVTEDNSGTTRKRIRRHNEYVLVAEESERGMEYSDLFWETRDFNAACYVEFSTAESRDRREEMFREIERIAVEHRSNPATPGDWDRLEVSATMVDDENFGWWMGEFTFAYSAVKRSV